MFFGEENSRSVSMWAMEGEKCTTLPFTLRSSACSLCVARALKVKRTHPSTCKSQSAIPQSPAPEACLDSGVWEALTRSHPLGPRQHLNSSEELAGHQMVLSLLWALLLP